MKPKINFSFAKLLGNILLAFWSRTKNSFMNETKESDQKLEDAKNSTSNPGRDYNKIVFSLAAK